MRDELAARPELVAVLRVAAFLVDGQPAGDNTTIPADAFIDVLPPFAGG